MPSASPLSALVRHLAEVTDWSSLENATTEMLGVLSGAISAHDRQALLKAADEALFRLASSAGGAIGSSSAGALPPLAARYGFRTADPDGWRDLGRVMAEAKVKPERRLAAEFACLVADGMADGPDAALAAFIGRVKNDATASWLERAEGFGQTLYRCGWFRQSGPALSQALKALSPAIQADAKAGGKLGHSLLGLLAFHSESPFEHQALVFQTILLPAMLGDLKTDFPDHALGLEYVAYHGYAKRVATQDPWKAALESWVPAMAQSGERVGRSLPYVLRPVPDDDAPPVIGFVLHRAQTQAHTEALFSFLKAVKALPQPPFTPIVYVLAGIDPALSALAEMCGVALIHLDQHGLAATPLPRILWLRKDMGVRGIEAVVFVSLPLSMAFTYGLRIAPVQMWWPMAASNLAIPHVDGLLGPGPIAEAEAAAQAMVALIESSRGG